jgi:L-amino acid N-acyltransferase YncA
VSNISLGIADIDDMQTILDLRNQPSNFRYSSAEVDSKTHNLWYLNRINTIDSEPIWLIYLEGKSIGYVRFDKLKENGRVFIVSIAIKETYQGLGIGKKALQISISKIKLLEKNITLQAKIHVENKSSLSIFESVGFQQVSQYENSFLILEKNIS